MKETLLILIGVLILVGFFLVFAYAFWREARRTPWDLLEMLIMFICIGHVIALPIAYVLKDTETHPQERWMVVIAGVSSLIFSMFMVGGAVWVFRRLNRLGERRRGVRIVYLIAGLLLFPSLAIPVWGWIAGFPIWIYLQDLHRKSDHIPDPGDESPEAQRKRERLEREQALQKPL